MIDLQDVRINTAGAYIRLDGCYLFAMGIRPHSGSIPIIRLGGHRQEQETGWECAVREVSEEARLHIQPLLPQTTTSVSGIISMRNYKRFPGSPTSKKNQFLF